MTSGSSMEEMTLRFPPHSDDHDLTEEKDIYGLLGYFKKKIYSLLNSFISVKRFK